MSTDTTKPGTVDIVADDGTFPVPGGGSRYRLSVRPADPAAVRARLAVVHGYGDHAGRYRELMVALAAHGVACHAFDLRGHGRSSGRRAFVRRWDDYLDDLRAFLDLPDLRAPAARSASPPAPALTPAPAPAAAAAPAAAPAPAPAPVPPSASAPAQPPLFLFGHSHGGLIVAAAGVRWLLPAGVAGCVLSAPYLVNALPVARLKLAAAGLLNAVVPWVRIRSGVTPEMMSADPAMAAESRADPLLLRSATPRWFVVHRPVQSEVLARAGQFGLPLLVLYGDADPIADPRGAVEFHARAGSPDKVLIAYPGFRHEPFREAGRERVFADVLSWVEGRMKGRDGVGN